MAILITGGSGFVGLSIAERILRRGAAVLLFSAEPAPADFLRRLPNDRLDIAIGDIRSPTDLVEACRNHDVDEVIHLAAVTPGPERERADPATIVSVNVVGPAVLMKVIANLKPKRVVVVSSVAVYGLADPGPRGAYSEALSQPAPQSLYGVTKLAAEQTALRLGDIYDMDVRVVRLGPVYGPWEHQTDVRDAMSPHRQILARLAARSGCILPRAMPADWIYVRDAARGIIGVLRARGTRHRTFNLGGGMVTDLVQWCRAVGARRPELEWRLASAGERPNIVYNLPHDRAPLDNSLITAETGFQAEFSLEAAVDDYLKWLDASAPATRVG